MDRLPALLERKKIGGRDLPTEVFIRKKRESLLCRLVLVQNLTIPLVAMFRRKHVARGGKSDDYIDSIRISPVRTHSCSDDIIFH